jgi:haloalkane dehalogenase
MRQWIEALDLREITLVCQDWGSLIGLRLLAEMPERFARVTLSPITWRWSTWMRAFV